MEILWIVIPLIIVIIICSVLYSKKILKHYCSEISAFISGYLLFLCDYKKDTIFSEKIKWVDINPLIIGFSIVIIIASIIYKVWGYKKLLEKEEYERKLNRIQEEYTKLCGDYIKIIFSDFFKISNNQGGRVSIYKIQNDKFILLGRYSNHNEYNKRGRDSYPTNKGFISEGWNKGEFSIYDIPKWTKSNSGREYKNYVKNFCKENDIGNIDDATLKKITMKSRSFFIKTIENGKSDSRQDIGIIVFEKMEPSQIDSDTIKQKISENIQQVKALMRTMKTIHE